MRTSISRRFAAILILLAATSGLASAAANLVTNGNFETGNLAGWTQSGNTANTGVSTASQSLLTADANNIYGAFAGPNSLGFLSQDLVTAPGQSYIVSFFFQLPSGAGPPNEFSSTFGGVDIYPHLTDINPGYAYVSGPMTASTAVTTLQFGFRTNGRDYWNLDDVSVVPTPESGSTLAIFGIAVIALAAFRRKATNRLM